MDSFVIILLDYKEKNMYYFHNEQAFLSVYTRQKLMSGHLPVITKAELKSAAQKVYCKNCKAFKFDNLTLLSEKFEDTSKIVGFNKGKAFTITKESLHPTYQFVDFTTKYDERIYFGSDDNNVDKIPGATIAQCDEQSKNVAALATEYIVDRVAQKYIAKEIDNGHWSCQMSKTSYIFKDDLGRTLNLGGTKKCFADFYIHTYRMIACMTMASNGKLEISSNKGGTLAYNNFKRVVAPFPLFDESSTELFVQNRQKGFHVKIDGENVTADGKTLVKLAPQTSALAACAELFSN